MGEQFDERADRADVDLGQQHLVISGVASQIPKNQIAGYELDVSGLADGGDAALPGEFPDLEVAE